VHDILKYDKVFKVTGRWGTGLDKETIKEMFERGEVYEVVGDEQDSEKVRDGVIRDYDEALDKLNADSRKNIKKRGNRV